MGALLDLLFPPRCAFCHRFVTRREGNFCDGCRSGDALPWSGDSGEKHGDFFRVCVFPLYYEKDVRESLHRYKFGGCSFYAEIYGPVLADCIDRRLAGEYDLLTWVPLSRKRLRARGYDQARLLAEAAGRALGMEAVPLLEKTRDTAKQSRSGSAEKRRANVSGAYRVPDPSRVAGKRVLMVDDIATTGATLSECARMLKTAGAAEVVCAALAGTR